MLDFPYKYSFKTSFKMSRKCLKYVTPQSEPGTQSESASLDETERSVAAPLCGFG